MTIQEFKIQNPNYFKECEYEESSIDEEERIEEEIKQSSQTGIAEISEGDV